MGDTKEMVLDKTKVIGKINRLAYQIYEDNSTEKEVIIAGIDPNGYQLATRLAKALENISPLKARLIRVTLDKDDPHADKIEISVPEKELEKKVIILVDDVLNSGKTLIYGLRPFLNMAIKKLRTVVLVDRNHKRYPVSADFVGLSLATTLHEHITVRLDKGNEGIFLQ